MAIIYSDSKRALVKLDRINAQQSRAQLPEQLISKERSGAFAHALTTFKRIGSDLVKVNEGIEQPFQSVLAKLSIGKIQNC